MLFYIILPFFKSYLAFDGEKKKSSSLDYLY